MYDRNGLSTKCTLIKTSFKNFRTGTEAKFRPFVDALVKKILQFKLGRIWLPKIAREFSNGGIDLQI